MTVAVYVRVSTQRQAQAQTIEQQLERLRAHLRSRGLELASEGCAPARGVGTPILGSGRGVIKLPRRAACEGQYRRAWPGFPG